MKIANLNDGPPGEFAIGHINGIWRDLGREAGTRSDMCFYPQSGRVSLRGLGIALRSPEIEYLPGL